MPARAKNDSLQHKASEVDAKVHPDASTPKPNNGGIEEKYQKVRKHRSSKLKKNTGWPWDARELAHFYSAPISSPREYKSWRQDTLNKLNSPKAEPLLNLAVQRVREISRILSVLYSPQKDAAPSKKRDENFSRVFERLMPFRELRETIEITEPDKELVPPLLQEKLFLYLSKHGAQICQSKSPNCSECEIARFCGTFRREALIEYNRSNRPVIVDLFCGAGGMSVGFDKAGFQTACASDTNANACRTFSLNHPGTPEENVINDDITKDETVEKIVGVVNSVTVDVLVGGPPCQGFSRVGHSASRALRSRRMHSGFGEEDDERNYLFEYMIEVASRINPRVVLMENVPGMDSKRGDLPSFMQVAEAMLQELGYSTAIWELDAASYGVPQHRLRKFLVASLAPIPPAIPKPDYLGRVRSMNNAEDLLRPVTLNQAIADLPELGIDDGDEVQPAKFQVEDGDRFLKHFISRKFFPIRSSEKVIYNHRSRYNNDRDVELFSILDEGENGLDVVQKHGRSDLMRYRKDAFHDKYYRLQGDLPSRTIVSHLGHDGNGYIHPSQARTITPRESARLQSFPDSYVFCGPASSQWRQIGNAVPPLLAYSIATSIRDHLKRFFD